MPLALIGTTLALAPADAAAAVADYWSQVESTLGERKALVSYLRARLTGDRKRMYEVKVRTMPDRKMLTINRHVLIDGTDDFFNDAFACAFGPPHRASRALPAYRS